MCLALNACIRSRVVCLWLWLCLCLWLWLWLCEVGHGFVGVGVGMGVCMRVCARVCVCGISRLKRNTDLLCYVFAEL